MRLPITQIYRYGIIQRRALGKIPWVGIQCSVCETRFEFGLGGTNPETDDDLCVSAFSRGWRLPATGTYCDTCVNKPTYPVYRALGWFLNWFPFPTWLLTAVLLACVAWFGSIVVQYEFTEIPQVEVIEQ